METYVDIRLANIPENDFEQIVDWAIEGDEVSKKSVNIFSGASIWKKKLPNGHISTELIDISIEDISYSLSFVRNGDHKISLLGQHNYIGNIVDSLTHEQLVFLRTRLKS